MATWLASAQYRADRRASPPGTFPTGFRDRALRKARSALDARLAYQPAAWAGIDLQDAPERVRPPDELTVAAEQAEAPDRVLTSFEAASRSLLLLGAPGGGKTTQLLSLAAGLMRSAQVKGADDSVPVVLDLASFRGTHCTAVAYVLLPWAEGSHLRGPELSLEQAGRLGELAGHIHHRLNSLPPGSGLARMTAAPRSKVADQGAAIAEADRYLRLISSLEVRLPFDVTVAELLEQRKMLLQEYGERRPASDSPAGPAGWTHGDLQYRNLLWHDGEIAAVLDWDRIQVRTFAEELTRTAMVQFMSKEGLLDLERVGAFVAGYRRLILLRPEDAADALDRLWWRRMTSFWQLDFHYTRGNHGAAELIVPTERLLAWCAEHREEVAAAFTAI
ncbi:phosphotransferase [Nonomuraea angiospora]|uniref:phosphotransferase n=1 Tax=Nonomuraea angiospora TaxID=46172 RepID=UPI00366E988D